MHMVMFTSSEGKSATHTTESLEEAVRFVEHIRNNEAVDDARLFRMTEIPLEVKAYYKVEIGNGGADSGMSTLTAVPASEVAEPAI